jgi:hypothetical protein
MRAITGPMRELFEAPQARLTGDLFSRRKLVFVSAKSATF